MARFRIAWFHFKTGWSYGYPVCCVVTFAAAHLVGRSGQQAINRGLIPHPHRSGVVYVACQRCRHRHPDWREHSAWNWHRKYGVRRA